MSVYDRWHLARPPAGAKTCGKHKGKVAGAEHGIGLRWQVRGIDSDQRVVKRNFEYEDDAKAFDAELKAAVRAGTYVDDRLGKVTFQAYAEGWRKARVHDRATAERIETALRVNAYSAPGTPGRIAHGGPSIGDHQMRALARRPSLLQEWIRGLGHLHQNTVRKVIGDVSQVFKAAIDDGIISRNPLKASSVQRPKAITAEVIPWTAEQVAAVAEELPDRSGALAYLGAACGLRQGELFAVAKPDLDFFKKTLHVAVQIKFADGTWHFAPPKNLKIRDVPVADPVIPVLAEHMRQFPPVPVTLPFGSAKGKPITRNLIFTWPQGEFMKRTGFNPVWIRAWKAAGIPDHGSRNGMHVLRRSAACAWLSAGLNLAKVAAYLGDTKEVVVRNYASFLPDDDNRARDIMNSFFGALAERQTALISPSSAVEGE